MKSGTTPVNRKPIMKPIERDAVAAGVVTFNPDIDRLMENLGAVSPQAGHLIIFDNGSRNIVDIRTAVGEIENADLIECAENLGVATALNRIASSASERGFRWLLTLDQDSVCAPDMIEKLSKYATEETPLVTPFILDRNKMTTADFLELSLPPVQFFRHAAIKGAITSGGLMNLQVFDDVQRFDEQFFIDFVDYDFNMRLMRAGYRIARVNDTYLLHELGIARKTWLRTPRKTLDGRWRWETFYSFGHSPVRCYYKARNRVLYSRKHWRSIGFSNEGIAQIPQQMFLTLLFEEEKFSKFRAFLRGVVDGVRAPLVQQQENSRTPLAAKPRILNKF